jgi:hypothetical protein
MSNLTLYSQLEFLVSGKQRQRGRFWRLTVVAEIRYFIAI